MSYRALPCRARPLPSLSRRRASRPRGGGSTARERGARALTPGAEAEPTNHQQDGVFTRHVRAWRCKPTAALAPGTERTLLILGPQLCSKAEEGHRSGAASSTSHREAQRLCLRTLRAFPSTRACRRQYSCAWPALGTPLRPRTPSRPFKACSRAAQDPPALRSRFTGRGRTQRVKATGTALFWNGKPLRMRRDAGPRRRSRGRGPSGRLFLNASC